MAKGLVGGMTDYSHQSFNDIISDLESEKENTIAFIKMIEEGIEKSNENKYWDNKVPYDFKSIVAYSLKHYRTTVTELSEIVEEIKNEVQEHHFRRLQRISKVANEINSEIGQVWNRKYDDKIKDYGEKKFLQVEQVYSDTRDMAVNLLDISNIASRLKDYIGKNNNMGNKNKLGDLSNNTFNGHTTIIVGDNNKVNYTITEGSFDSLKDMLSKNGVSSEDISELKMILESEKPNDEKKIFGNQTNGWVSKMITKSLEGSWSIGIGAAGKLLADGIKAYYGWHN
jgi:hypothetical protein